MINKIFSIKWPAIILMALQFYASSTFGYGVFTHEAIVDACWDKSIVPLLLKKYPGSTKDQINEAHAYAYGGSVAPDMGYYPLGSHLFTNLVHYVRSGDMVKALLKDAQNINEYAFALGFLSHYYADNYGHPIGTNQCVPLLYPKLKRKYGSEVTYAENRISHLRMEFGFDVLQVAKGNYASPAYRDFIGFKVDTSVLSRAFIETYGLSIDQAFGNHFQRAVETFRWIVANIFPFITKTAWASRKNEITKLNPSANSKSFAYKMHQKQYNKQYGKGYRRPGLAAGLISFFVRVLPKVGPLRPLKFKTPTPAAEKLFDRSFDSVLLHYTVKLKSAEMAGDLKNLDFDTGEPTAACEYILGDRSYCQLLVTLADHNFEGITPGLKQNIRNFFPPPAAVSPNSRGSKKCNEFQSALSKFYEIHSGEN